MPQPRPSHDEQQIVVSLPAALVALFPGCPGQLKLSATSVHEMIDVLDSGWPGMRDRLCDSTPRIRRHMNIFVAGERVSLATPLAPGAEVMIMTAISGG
jgi:molybdopterin synthase sulfur carrier subunit